MTKTKRLVGLRCVKVVQLKATNGKEMIATAGKIFPGGIFGKVEPEGKSMPTEMTQVVVYKITKNNTTEQFVERLGSQKPWQDSQILAFCRDYPYWVPGTSFLLEAADGTLFVVSTGIDAVVIGPFDRVKTYPAVVGRNIAVLKL
ncbi:hypothetical protein A2738_02245 [Candidatus Nomurabacteria bacterium RIFCSPHIGHO2_01_FULL_42_15]|uniref:Uncharacterized protein n=1 Tax=Candidatus Nomurabacteria bacterium RIFCSPHIGHO2_01_FULL_42_15 TaxID=1801742 RepID=A0A1F6VF58_9BACT|nr:MAG: hypothetical protein A2738_02245 [Candidatus Nomurabacteria bacterium RIFCSPHIGHO2_01_FULL_42_15]OGI93421.1 MAG: hypothetical protein A3A99_01975 [Candidatus Nomurabacteria bacterium RIFCSPLOWO2_01_FULL_41_18]